MSSIKSSSFLKEFEPEDVELAQQLLSLNQRPSQALQRRVEAIPHKPRWGLPLKPPRLVWSAVVLMVIMMLVASPTAKATLSELEKVVGQIHLKVMEVKPVYSEPVVIEGVPMSLEDARAAVSFDFAVPTYIPAALKTSNSEVSVIDLETTLVKMLWRDADSGFVQFTAYSLASEGNLAQTLVGPESSQTISINGHPAVLVHGGWDESSQTWSYQDQLTTLIWTVEDVQYKLLAFQNPVSLTDLTAMAESVR